MKQLLSLTLILLISVSIFSQPKKGGKVKRKYREVEQISQNLPEVILRGFVYDEEKLPIVGAAITVDGALKAVNTNEDGEFYLEN